MPQLAQKTSLHQWSSTTIRFILDIFQHCLKVPSELAFLGHLHSSSSPCWPTYQLSQPLQPGSPVCLSTSHHIPHPIHWIVIETCSFIRRFFILPLSMHSRVDMASSMWQIQVFWGLKIIKFGELSLRKTSHYEYKHLVMFLSPCWSLCHIHWGHGNL